MNLILKYEKKYSFLFTPEVGIYKRNIFRKKIRKRFRRRKKVSFKKKERIKLRNQDRFRERVANQYRLTVHISSITRPRERGGRKFYIYEISFEGVRRKLNCSCSPCTFDEGSDERVGLGGPVEQDLLVVWLLESSKYIKYVWEKERESERARERESTREREK